MISLRLLFTSVNLISQFRGPFLLQGQKFVYIEIFPSVWTKRYFDIVRTSTQLVRVHFSEKKENNLYK